MHGKFVIIKYYDKFQQSISEPNIIITIAVYEFFIIAKFWQIAKVYYLITNYDNKLWIQSGDLFLPLLVCCNNSRL